MERSRGWLSLGVLALVALMAAPSARADSWSEPEIARYLSSGGHARLIITPARRIGKSTETRARLERLTGKRWERVWDRAISNPVSPVEAIVRDDGKYVVTFDDWGALGYGSNVVAIYGPKGERVRALALSALVSRDYIEALPHSVSSIMWRGDPRFSSDGRKVLIPVIIPASRMKSTTDLAVNLFDGTAMPVDELAWKAAQRTGHAVLMRQREAAAVAKAAFLAPLLGPKINAQRQWHHYLSEAVGRLLGDDETPSTTVLRMPGAIDYAISEVWVREALTDRFADKVALASLSEQNLVSVLGKIAAKIPDRSLSKVTVFVAVSSRNWSSVMLTMRKTGANLVQLDPAKPIAQRSERIARRYGR